MKKISLITLLSLSLSLFIFSCSSDESGGDEQMPLEELSATVVDKSINIQGATKKTGTPPASNGDLSFETKASTANIDEGFFIEINTDDDIDGVYIQLVDEDGKAIDNYIDVPSSSFLNADDLIPDINIPNTTGKSAKIKMVDGDTQVIDVNFTVDLAPGNFCYFICVYDEETGFVSQPTEVCVTVNDWGGNNSLAGSWAADLSDEDNDFLNTCFTINEFYPVIECDNGSELQPVGEICFEYLFELNLTESGDFNYIIDLDYTNIDLIATEEQCETVFENIKFNYSYNGKWSYDAATETLTMVLSSFSFEGNVTPFDEGILLYSDKVSLNGDKLIFVDEFINTTFVKK